jgi:hypothetical protein
MAKCENKLSAKNDTKVENCIGNVSLQTLKKVCKSYTSVKLKNTSENLLANLGQHLIE